MEWDDVFEKISPSNKTSYIYHYNTDTGKIRKLMEYDCSKSLNHTLFHFYLRDSLLYYTVYTELHCINIETCTDSLLYDIHEWDFHINPTETGFSILTIDKGTSSSSTGREMFYLNLRFLATSIISVQLSVGDLMRTNYAIMLSIKTITPCAKSPAPTLRIIRNYARFPGVSKWFL